MKTLIRSLIVLAAFASVGSLSHAQDAEAERTKGKVLLLKNGHAMEGDIEKVGSQLCIRRGASEVWIASDRMARLCADWDDAFQYARSRVKSDDADGMVKLARWCHLHQLNDKALDQARLALQLEPKNSDAKQIVTMLERVQKHPLPKPAAPLPVIVPSIPEVVPTVDVSSESSILFTTRVQPILMNTCASCHSGNYGGKFHLDRVHDNTQRGATMRNLAAVMPYIDLDRPAISPLLTRAITPHGDATMPAIRDRSSRPFQTMQEWIKLTVARNPQLKDYAAAKKGAVPAKREPEPVIVTTGFASDGQKSEPMDQNLAPANAPAARTEAAPRSLPMLSDRYGADQFNKQYHPNR
jgi:hypothetical protein